MYARTKNSAEALSLVIDELRPVIAHIVDETPDALDRLADLVADAERVFLLGAGRSGLALRMTAMRLMHLGLEAYVVGDTTTPAIRKGDLLLAASGSGTTGGIVKSATKAVEVGATVACFTTDPTSPLAELSGATLVIPAAGKLDRSGEASAQYAGSLFEQAVVLCGDALFQTLWQRSGASAEELWPRHANLE